MSCEILERGVIPNFSLLALLPSTDSSRELILKDFNMGGEKFTFMSRADSKLSNLDRFLVFSNYLTSFPLSVVTAHPRELSNHSPITLLSVVSDFVLGIVTRRRMQDLKNNHKSITIICK